MSALRRRLLEACIVAAGVAFVFAGLSGKEVWPFVTYKMYSGLTVLPRRTEVRPYALYPDGSERLLAFTDAIEPFEPSRLNASLGKLAKGDPATLADALRELLTRVHSWDGRVIGLRVYREVMTVDVRSRPVLESREFIAEQRLAGKP